MKVQFLKSPPPPPKAPPEPPKQVTKKVPRPDPTPDEPEPIRVVDEIQPELDIPTDDTVFGIPEGPPSAEPDGPAATRRTIHR